jgi:ubiquitin-activating enzyme E1
MPLKKFPPLLRIVYTLLLIASVCDVCGGRSTIWARQSNHRTAVHSFAFSGTRGGYSYREHQEDENDEERYSRQLYTVGARAHSLIRNATVYLDGPPKSGLLYECAKNLALSGIRHLILVVGTNADGNDVDEYYHNAAMDDLGYTYRRGACAEIFGENDRTDVSDADILVEYLKRLNPSILVSQEKRATLYETNSESHLLPSQAVLLAVDRPFSTTLSLNRVARHRNWTFVATETAGVFGQVFCDFGSAFVVHDTDGETPANTPLDRVESLDGTLLVHCIPGERHDVSKGDLIRFQYRNGDFSTEHCRVVDVQTPFRFVAELVMDEDDSHATSEESFLSLVNQDAVSFCRVKLPRTLSFEPLDALTDLAAIKESLFTACDLQKSHDLVRRWTSMSCFRALSVFAKAQKRLPTETDTKELWSVTKSVWPQSNMEENDEVNGYFRAFVSTCLAKFTPLQAAVGAIAAQEAMKAITGLYTPVHQFLLYDCDEVLSEDCDAMTLDKASSRSSLNGDSCGLRYILGNDIADKLQSQKVFVVGSGAIGCEILKNLASMGVGTGKHGKVIVTDMDTIEKSNLSRQLLFRDIDIGKFKSAAAHEAAKRLNHDMKIETHACKVGELEMNNPFDDAFWSNGVDIVLNALDNVDARLYMDQQCVRNKKALVDAGTMGPKGNVQVVVPFQSESYASSIDPPEPSIPVCTLKNFPYAISHTIQWGRELFDDLFERRPEQANDFLDSLVSTSKDELAIRLIQEKGADSAMERALELAEDLSFGATPEDTDLHVVKKRALAWAIELAIKLFQVNPVELLSKHPLDSVDEEGLPFWSGTRRPPVPLSYESLSADQGQVVVNRNFLEFVRNGARLRLESILDSGLNDCMFTIDEVNDALAACFGSMKKPPPEKYINEDNVASHSVQVCVREYLGKIDYRDSRMVAIEFEKDDDSNGHVAFVNAASNLRAIVYGIAPVDAMETRRVAGNIVPAMISTTALVSALSCMELVKLVQNVDLRRHRNAFVNLALPFFAFTMPLPADPNPGLDGMQYTLWDQFLIRESEKAALFGGITVKGLLKQIRKMSSSDPARVSVSSISIGPYMLYANFLQVQENDILNRSLWELCTEATSSYDAFDEDNPRESEGTSSVISLNDAFVDLTVVVEDVVTGDEVELPTVRVQRYGK